MTVMTAAYVRIICGIAKPPKNKTMQVILKIWTSGRIEDDVHTCRLFSDS